MIVNLDEFLEYTAGEFNSIVNSIIKECQNNSSDIVLTNFVMSFGYVCTKNKPNNLRTTTRTFSSGNISNGSEMVEHPHFLDDTIKMLSTIKDGSKAGVDEETQESSMVLRHE